MKKFISVLLAVLLCTCPAFASEPVAEPLPKETVGIISAMDNEAALLLAEAEIDHTDTVGGVDFHVGTLCGMPVVIARSGIGKVLASAGITAMLNRYPITRVIFTGIAGGVGDETAVLDEVIATRLVQHDYGMITNDGFVWSSGVSGEEEGEKSFYLCDPAMVNFACDAAVQVMGEEHVFRGTIASGDQFVASEEYVKRLQADFDALACEMEGAAIAAVCEQYDTPFVVIRALSDKADGNAHESIDDFGDLAADNSSRIVMRMLDVMASAFAKEQLHFEPGDEPYTGASVAGNFTDEMKFDDGADLSIEDGADSVERDGDHADSPYFSHPDFYNMESTDTLTILPHFKTIQQSSEWSCGVASALMVLEWYGLRGDYNEETLAELRPQGLEPGATSLSEMVAVFDGVGGFECYSAIDAGEDVYDIFTFDYIQETLAAGDPIIIGWNDWGGHWQVIIGYDTMGTETTQDDVIIVADPYDTTDHNQDGYGIYGAERFLYNFTFYNFFEGDELNDMCFLVAKPA